MKDKTVDIWIATLTSIHSKFKFYGFSLLLLSFYTCSPESNPIDARKHFDKANNFFESGDYLQAIKEYGHALDNDPNSAQVYLKRGLARIKLLDKRYWPMANGHFGYTIVAVQEFKNAIKIDSNCVEAYYQLGFSYELCHYHEQAIVNSGRLNYYNEAVSNYEKALVVIKKGNGSNERLVELEHRLLRLSEFQK